MVRRSIQLPKPFSGWGIGGLGSEHGVAGFREYLRIKTIASPRDTRPERDLSPSASTTSYARDVVRARLGHLNALQAPSARRCQDRRIVTSKQVLANPFDLLFLIPVNRLQDNRIGATIGKTVDGGPACLGVS
jgi:hypothetical protein